MSRWAGPPRWVGHPQLGYLTRVDDPLDRRSTRVYLTERGQSAAQTIRSTAADIEAELQEQLGTKEFGELRRLSD